MNDILRHGCVICGEVEDSHPGPCNHHKIFDELCNLCRTNLKNQIEVNNV